MAGALLEHVQGNILSIILAQCTGSLKAALGWQDAFLNKTGRGATEWESVLQHTWAAALQMRASPQHAQSNEPPMSHWASPLHSKGRYV